MEREGSEDRQGPAGRPANGSQTQNEEELRPRPQGATFSGDRRSAQKTHIDTLISGVRASVRHVHVWDSVHHLSCYRGFDQVLIFSLSHHKGAQSHACRSEKCLVEQWRQSGGRTGQNICRVNRTDTLKNVSPSHSSSTLRTNFLLLYRHRIYHI